MASLIPVNLSGQVAQQAELTSLFLRPNYTGWFWYDCSRPSGPNPRYYLQYPNWIKTMLMLWSSAEKAQNSMSLGDLLLFAHDQRSTNADETNRVFPNSEKDASSSLPDKMFNVLTNEESQLTADEIVRFVSSSSTGVRSIASNFEKNLATNSRCINITKQNMTSTLDCYKQLFHSNLSHALRVLKHLVQPAHSKIYPDKTLDFKTAVELLVARNNYSPTCSFTKGNCLNHDPVFRHCHFGHETEARPFEEDCSFFRRTFGIKGISYEFNPSIGFYDIYSDKNAYNRMFYREIHSQDIGGQGKNIALSDENILDFFIYPDSYEKYFLSAAELSELQLAIHHPTMVPTKFIKLRRGYR